MRWASRLATEPDHPAAIEAALAGLAADLDGAAADLVVAFASPDFDGQLPGLFARVSLGVARRENVLMVPAERSIEFCWMECATSMRVRP